jgi:predicted kinase
MYITAKTKGTPILKDSEFGNFFSLTCEALKWNAGNTLMSDLPPLLMNLLYDSYQSISFELCGSKEPHLVKYDFDIDLKPLFYTRMNGRIEPYTYGNHREFVDSANVVTACTYAQNLDTELNTSYRSSLRLPHKYEYEHFAVEGKVLYLLDDDGICINRTLYKVKARDVEEVHWQTFDATMQGRVREALDKLGRDELKPTESNIREELDMGPKEWDKFGKAIMTYAGANPGKDERRVLVLVGLPGSGKSSIARQLESRGWVRVNQDELGSRNKCKELMEKALVENKKVVVDRCNFDVRQRKSWIDLAAKYGVTNVQALTINTDPDVCKDRIVSRENHPTVAPVEASKAIVDSFNKMMVPATHEEGFSYLMEFSGEGSTDELIDEITSE